MKISICFANGFTTSNLLLADSNLCFGETEFLMEAFF